MISAMLTNDSGAWRGKFPHLLRPCTRNAIHNNQAHSTKRNSKGFYFQFICIISQAFIIPSGISIHSAMIFFSCNCVVVYTCNLHNSLASMRRANWTRQYELAPPLNALVCRQTFDKKVVYVHRKWCYIGK